MGAWPPNNVALLRFQNPRPPQLLLCLLYALLVCLCTSSATAYGNNVLAIAASQSENELFSAKFFTHLKTMQKSVCDGDILHIKCPRNTSITFNTVFYGRNASYGRLCPSSGRPQTASDDTTCIWKGALPLLVEACKNQQECKVNPQKEFRQRDPCPHIKKATDVTYQCRPNLFLHKTVCHGEKMLLKCQGKQRRLLIFSAFFGATKLGVTECHQQDDIAKECSAPGATDTVLTECQGRRRCQLTASQERFGRIFCAKQAAMFLRVVYTCVSREILKEYDNDDEDFTTDEYTISSTPTSSTPALPTSPPAYHTTQSPAKSPDKTSTASNGVLFPPRESDTGTPGRAETTIIYTVPKPGEGGEGFIKSSGVLSGVHTSNHGGSGSPTAATSPSLSGLIELVANIRNVPRHQLVFFAVGAGICLCLIFSMICLIGSLQKGRRKKQQRKKLVVLTPSEFDDMGETSDTLSMGHIAPPTLTSTLHRASQGSLLGGTLPRHSQGPPPIIHMTDPGSNPGQYVGFLPTLIQEPLKAASIIVSPLWPDRPSSLKKSTVQPLNKQRHHQPTIHCFQNRVPSSTQDYSFFNCIV